MELEKFALYTLDPENHGLEKEFPFKIWDLLVSMILFWGVFSKVPTDSPNFDICALWFGNSIAVLSKAPKTSKSEVLLPASLSRRGVWVVVLNILFSHQFGEDYLADQFFFKRVGPTTNQVCLSCTVLAYCREMMAAMRDKKIEERVEVEQTTLECHLSTEITKEALKECCGDDLTWYQWLSFAWSVVRAFGNLGLLIYTWLIIKPLQKDKPWDLEKHIVVCGEGLFSATILGVLILEFFVLVFQRDRMLLAKYLVLSKNSISIGANFSFLKSLPLAQPEAAWKHMSQVMGKFQVDLRKVEEITGLIKIGLYACVILVCILLVSLALMSVSVKVSQLGFISDGMYWTPTHYLAFGLFINALAGLRGDMEKQRLVSTLLGCGFKHFLFSPVCVEDSHFDSHVYTCLYIFRCCWSQPPTRFALLGGDRAFHLKLAYQLLDLHQESRLKALIVFSTMTSEKCIELLKKEPT